MPKPRKGPAASDVRRIFKYDPETGEFSRICRSGRVFPGDRVGTVRSDGYMQSSVCNKQYLLHRLAVIYMTGEWPSDEVDHINGDKTDNRWCNLRVVSSKTNKENRHRIWKSKRTSPLLGVTRTRGGRWTSAITHNYKVTRLGHFDTEEDAHKAYIEAKNRLHSGHLLAADRGIS